MGSKSGVAIIGGGIIGLSLALELERRGWEVTVLERARAGERSVGQASWAAAGMLAAEDPHNPEELRELSRWSEGMYDGYLARVQALSGLEVPYQTARTVQWAADGSRAEIAERSIDPRQLVLALEGAVEAAAGVTVRRGVEVLGAEEGCRLRTTAGPVEAGAVVWANGSWCGAVPGMKPRKGQMLRVRLPEEVAKDVVHRSEEVYVVPRTQGPEAGTALIGATVEDCGFGAEVEAAALAELRRRAARMVPAVGDEARAPAVEAWVGFRPAVPGGLPVMDRVPGRGNEWVATGHFRNGILLAPGTAVAMAELMEGRRPAVAMGAFRYPA